MDCWCFPGQNVIPYLYHTFTPSTIYNDIKFIVKCNERFNKQPPNIIFSIVNEWVCVYECAIDCLITSVCLCVNAREWITKEQTHIHTHTHTMEKRKVWMKINSNRKRSRNKNIFYVRILMSACAYLMFFCMFFQKWKVDSLV